MFTENRAEMPPRPATPPERPTPASPPEIRLGPQPPEIRPTTPPETRPRPVGQIEQRGLGADLLNAGPGIHRASATCPTPRKKPSTPATASRTSPTKPFEPAAPITPSGTTPGRALNVEPFQAR
jgi:hypothetical protein